MWPDADGWQSNPVDADRSGWLDHGTATQLGVEFAHALRLAPDRFVAHVLNSGRSAEARAAVADAPANA